MPQRGGWALAPSRRTAPSGRTRSNCRARAACGTRSLPPTPPSQPPAHPPPPAPPPPLSYADTQRHRLGPNYLMIPVNAPRCPARNNHHDGLMNFAHRDEEVNYFPSR